MVIHLPKGSGIYAVRNIINGKLWVGQTVNICKRCRQHRTNLRMGTGSPHLQSAWDKYSESSFEFSTIELCLRDELDSRENYWIDFYKSSDRNYGYNIEKFARGTGTRSPEVCKKIGDAHRGKPERIKHKAWHHPISNELRRVPLGSQLPEPWILGGKPQSPEAIAKRVKANTGKRRTQATKDKMSCAQTGKHHSPATIAKLSEYGKKRTDVGRNIFGQLMKLGADPTVGTSSSGIGGKIQGKIQGRKNVESGQLASIQSMGGKTAACLRWNINRGKLCTCGKHLTTV